MMRRLISKKQEAVLKCCHHDFEGLPQAEAAKKLNVSQSAVSDALKQIKKILPSFFPILTALEAKCYHLFAIEGWNVDDIAEHFGLTPDSVYKTLKRVKDKGAWSAKARGRVLQYSPEMDANIKEQF